MNPHAPASTSIWSFFGTLRRQQRTVWDMTIRDVAGRYKGSILGLLWSFLNPLVMLAAFTFVFSVVFKARWNVAGDESTTQFAIILFVGLIIHGIFAEALNKSPTLILANASFVKKVVFPLELLPIISLGSATFHAVCSFLVLLVFLLLTKGAVPWTAVLLPVILIPFLMLTLGFSWFLASLGVYMRDVAQTIALITTVMMYFAPVFYPATALPASIREWIVLNPLTVIIEESRAVLIAGEAPNWFALGIYTIVAIIVMQAGYYWFQKTRKGFADVI